MLRLQVGQMWSREGLTPLFRGWLYPHPAMMQSQAVLCSSDRCLNLHKQAEHSVPHRGTGVGRLCVPELCTEVSMKAGVTLVDQLPILNLPLTAICQPIWVHPL